ncbi:MAG: M15 family metallopeptidase [Syntrophales bacterium]|nr:M15 family metallopeptidase [Syntrophales bacterium]MCK9390278.1 M15 family metallopeptidase [Syntrophales bacterium]
MASRDIKDLVPELREKATLFSVKMKAANIPFIVTCTARLIKEQFALYAQGRHPLNYVNGLRRLAGMPPINAKENLVSVTWTLQSKHLIDLDDMDPKNDQARAFDIAIILQGKPIWDMKVNVNQNEIPDYTEAGLIGESIGLIWGGRFKNAKGKPRPDYPHFEI